MANKKLTSVFIVEDNSAQRLMLADHLSKYTEVKIKEYSGGDSCLRDLIEGNVQEPDLILMDYFLDSTFGTGSRDGLETLSKVKEIYPDMNVIMLTSVDNEKIIELARKKGALDYVVKGVKGFQKLDSILEKHFVLAKQEQN